MTANQLIELMNRSPFVAIEIHMSDGNFLRVTEPYQIATARNSATCTIYEGVDRMRVVSFRNITEVVTTVNGSK
jgi:hypothetical protein